MIRATILSGCLVLCTTITAYAAHADLGPKPIHGVGTWNRPEDFRLLDNHVSVSLGRDAARVNACFLFISTRMIDWWDKVDLEWAWPVPEGYPEPESLLTVKPSHDDAVALPAALGEIDRVRNRLPQPV